MTASAAQAAYAQERVRRVGVLSSLREDDTEGRSRDSAFVQGLQENGWVVGRNLQIDYRWSGGNADALRAHAAELIALKPDVVFATSGVSILPLQRASRSTPLVFAQTIDPVGLGIVDSLSHPGGNTTGFTQIEFAIAAKWLELLKQMVPATTHVAVLRDPLDPPGIGQWAAMQPVAPALGLELSVVNIRETDALESGINKAAGFQNAALLITSSAPGSVHRDLIIRLAAKRRLPAIYPYAFYVTAGGLFCYGPDTLDQYRRAASYVDRILKGEKPADLPVQAPTKYEMVINQNTAKGLGLTVPAALLAAADKVIE
jgi:putative ABC transport system substrate-binding protein